MQKFVTNCSYISINIIAACIHTSKTLTTYMNLYTCIAKIIIMQNLLTMILIDVANKNENHQLKITKLITDYYYDNFEGGYVVLSGDTNKSGFGRASFSCKCSFCIWLLDNSHP